MITLSHTVTIAVQYDLLFILSYTQRHTISRSVPEHCTDICTILRQVFLQVYDASSEKAQDLVMIKYELINSCLCQDNSLLHITFTEPSAGMMRKTKANMY